MSDWSLDRQARCRLIEATGLDHAFGTREHPAGEGAVTVDQVHGAALVDLASWSGPEQQADGLIAAPVSRPIAVRTADCAPVLIAAQDGSCAAAVHAGWRGAAAGIVPKAVAKLAAPPERLVAAIGPTIGACCYQVDRTVFDAFPDATESFREDGAGHWRFSLSAAIRQQLERAGLPAPAISVAPWCTACEASQFHSFRRDGAAAGRQFSRIGPA